jgi:quinol monooxygenase YgiN
MSYPSGFYPTEKEETMLAKVFIKRRVKKGKVTEVFQQLKKIRGEAMKQEGYISGETMFDPDDAQKILVISTWQSMDCWLDWKENDARKAANIELEKLLDEPTEYENYIYSKFYLKVKAGRGGRDA